MSIVVKIYTYMLSNPKTKRGTWGEWYFSKRYTKTLETLLEYNSGFSSFVELGCGKGLYAYHLTKLKPNCEYVGCDLDKTALKQAFKHRNVNYILCDVHHLPIKENSMNVVLCSEVLEHLLSPYPMLDSIADLSSETVLVTFPIEHLGKKIHAMHPEHVVNIELKKVVNRLTHNGLKVLKAAELSKFFIPCGILEFLQVPKNRFTMTLVSLIDLILEKLLPVIFVPDQTMLVVAAKQNNADV